MDLSTSGRGGRSPAIVAVSLPIDVHEDAATAGGYTTCTYDMYATIRRALRLEYDDADDPLQEVAAPVSASNDVMGMVDRAAE